MDYKSNLTEAAKIMGRLGGLKKSEKKTNACRENARRPRPNRRKNKNSKNLQYGSERTDQ